MKTISMAAGAAALIAVGVYAFPALTADKAADRPAETLKLPAAPPKSLPSVPQSMGQVQLTFAPVVKRAAPAVVNVYSKTIVQAQVNPFFNDPLFGQLFGSPEMRQRVQQSLGSGVIVRADGVIVTNNHVVEGGSEITIALSDKREFKAKVLLADPRTDLAVLKIDTRGERLPVVPFADSDAVAVGDLVLAIGDPFNVGQTVTMGIVSALARSQVATGDSQIFIQTDAAINPGNSGGALVTTDGRLAGINTAIYSRSGGNIGIGFAIPANLVRRVVEGVEGGLKNGGTASVQLAWVGASGQPVTSAIAASLGLSRPGGVLIKDVYPDGPLARAGIRSGEVVLSVDGVAVDDMQSLNYRTATHRPGDSVKMHVAAGKAARDVTVILALPPENPPRELATIAGRNPLTGAKVINVSPATAIELQMDVMAKGVAIVAVGANGFAARYGFQPGDIIRSINGAPITRTGELVRVLNGTNHWDMVIERAGRKFALSIEG